MSSKCRCGGTPEHVPWKCPSSKCAICKKGGHWARYCPVPRVMNFPTKTCEESPKETSAKTPEKSPVKTSVKTPVNTPEKSPPTPDKTPSRVEDAKSKSADPMEQTQPAETEMGMKVESQASPQSQRPLEVPEYARWKKGELLRECARFQLKSGTEKEMVGRLERSWETVNASQAKKPKQSSLPFW